MGLVIGLVGLWLSGFLVGRSWDRVTVKPVRIDSRWSELPSGWSRNIHGMTIYAMTQDGNAYWWVSRNGKTIIEGPSSSLDMAKVEAEREARELSP